MAATTRSNEFILTPRCDAGGVRPRTLYGAIIARAFELVYNSISVFLALRLEYSHSAQFERAAAIFAYMPCRYGSQCSRMVRCTLDFSARFTALVHSSPGKRSCQSTQARQNAYGKPRISHAHCRKQSDASAASRAQTSRRSALAGIIRDVCRHPICQITSDSAARAAIKAARHLAACKSAAL